MSTPLNRRIASTGFHRAVLLGLIGSLLMAVMVMNAVTTTNFGNSAVKLTKETFSDDADVAVAAKRIFRIKNSDVAPPAGGSAPGVDITSALPQVNNNLTKNHYAYEFEVKESGGDTLGSAENLKIEVFMDDGSTTTLLATLYTQQTTLENGVVEGVTVTLDTGSSNVLGDLFSIFITRQ